MTTPTVSVVMSVYNAERFLRESVESILNQSFSDFEFIIVNDGSSDGTRSILESYQDPRIILIHQENAGVTKALNSGLKLATGKYVARQDADDVSKPDRLSKQVAFLKANPAVGLLGTRFEFIDEHSQVTRLGALPTDNKTLQQRLPVINQFSHGSVMIRKEALDSVGLFREFFKYAQDYDLWLRIAEHYEVCNLPDYLFCYRELEQAISSTNVLTQSLYAGTAAELATQRRETGADALLQGTIPAFPPARLLSNDLHEKLLDFYCRHPNEMLNGLQVNRDACKDLVFLFERICSDNQNYQADLRNRNSIVDRVNGRTSGLLIEFQNHLIEKFDEIAEAVRSGFAEELGEKEREVEEKDRVIAEKLEELTHLRLAFRELDQQVPRLKEQIQLSEQQLQQADRCFREQQAQAFEKSEEVHVLTEELDRIKRERLAESRSYDESISEKEQQIKILYDALSQKEQRIADLINSKSWKVTAPLRKIFGILQRT
jgi:glycosyltransferase involved in cell wall biosynthesis